MTIKYSKQQLITTRVETGVSTPRAQASEWKAIGRTRSADRDSSDGIGAVLSDPIDVFGDFGEHIRIALNCTRNRKRNDSDLRRSIARHLNQRSARVALNINYQIRVGTGVRRRHTMQFPLGA